MLGTEEQLMKEMTTAYVGIDPTADSLHIGHLCGIMMLRHLQACGHKPIALLDDAPVLTMDDIGVGTASKGGDVTLEYKTTLK